ncbi:MAG: hypothetical protein RSD12_09675 [Akkermansia sp.]
MANDISLTVRLPHQLNIQLGAISKEVGITKTNLIRSAIHDFLPSSEYELDFAAYPADKRDRLVLNVNQTTCGILENACQSHGQSMNSIVTAVSVLALERAAKWLQAVRR